MPTLAARSFGRHRSRNFGAAKPHRDSQFTIDHSLLTIQNLKFHVTAGKMGNNETCVASIFSVPL